MKTNLLCTFVHKNDVQLVIDLIQEKYQLDSNIIFVLSNVNNPHQLYCTYNVIGNYQIPSNTILIHRKSDTGTLYTINAVNQIIKNMNNGVLDARMQLEWEHYKNELILFQNDEVHRVPLKLEKIIRL